MTKKIKNLKSIIQKCSESKQSIGFALIKLIACSLARIDFEIKKRPNSDSILVCYRNSYNLKPHIYDQIAERLQCTLILVYLTFPIPLNRTDLEVIKKTKHVYLWSDVQIKSMLFINNFLSKETPYHVFQHGAFPYSKTNTPPAISFEWQGTRARSYYAWTDTDKENILSSRPDLNVIVMGAPSESHRKLTDGYGFATRGPEFLNLDIDFLIKNSKKNQCYQIFFHPSYRSNSEKKFISICKTNGVTATKGQSGNVTKNLITLSRSFLLAAKKSNVANIITDESLI